MLQRQIHATEIAENLNLVFSSLLVISLCVHTLYSHTIFRTKIGDKLVLFPNKLQKNTERAYGSMNKMNILVFLSNKYYLQCV